MAGRGRQRTFRGRPTFSAVAISKVQEAKSVIRPVGEMGMGLAQLDIPHAAKALPNEFALQCWDGLMQDLILSA
jgi:hypothetical protein